MRIRIDMHERELRMLQSIKVECQSCEHYMFRHCNKFDAEPPPHVIATGCDEWNYDFIPF
jgi:hypothetical protein